MSEIVAIKTLEDLLPFLNDKNILEIAIREKNKRFKTFQKIVLNDIPKQEEKELLEKAIQALNKNIGINEKNLNLLGNLVKVEKIGLLLNGLNLCATCAGFYIVCTKLNEISTEIKKQIGQLQTTIKKGQDIHTGFEFNKVLSDHTDMLDCRRKQQPYSEERMRELVDQEYNVLTMLINVFQKDVVEDKKTLIFSIFSLLSMFTVSLRYFDEMYYENNHEVLGDKDVWHIAHENWMSVYTVLSSEWVIKKVQDYAMFETDLTTVEVDAYYISLLDQVLEQKQDIEDNQTLILELGDIELLRVFREMNNREVKQKIDAAFEEVGGGLNNPVVASVYGTVLNQVGFA